MRQVLLGALSGAALAATLPQEVGVDFVFPRELETYRPATPFPLVLAFHGAPSIWPPDLAVRLTLRQLGGEALETVVVNGTEAAEGLVEEDGGVYFAVLGMLEAGDVSGEVRLEWEFEYRMDCDGIKHERGGSSSVRFEFDGEGEEVDVVGGGGYCPKDVHSMLVDERVSEECLELGVPDLVDECRTEVPSGLGRGVKAKLEEIKECTDGDGDGCNDSPFIEGDWEGDDGDGSDGDDSGGGSDDSEGDDDSGALSLRGRIFSGAGSLALLVPAVASFLW